MTAIENPLDGEFVWFLIWIDLADFSNQLPILDIWLSHKKYR